jgi:single-strand DNA-binding protein
MLRNQVQLIGHLGKKPEVKHFEDGKVRATLRVATNDYYIDKQGERAEDTQWHGCVVYYYL